MMPFSLSEIGASALGAAALGAVFGFAYQILCLLKSFVSSLIGADWKTIVCKKRAKPTTNDLKSKIKAYRYDKCGHILNFLFTLFFGASYLIIQFVLCDGVFRLYFLAITVIFFLLGGKLFSQFLRGIFSHIFARFCEIFIFVIGSLARLFVIMLKLDRENRSCDSGAP